jgi:hypothetical protein
MGLENLEALNRQKTKARVVILSEAKNLWLLFPRR